MEAVGKVYVTHGEEPESRHTHYQLSLDTVSCLLAAPLLRLCNLTCHLSVLSVPVRANMMCYDTDPGNMITMEPTV